MTSTDILFYRALMLKYAELNELYKIYEENKDCKTFEQQMLYQRVCDIVLGIGTSPITNDILKGETNNEHQLL